MKKFILSNKIYLPIFALIGLTMIYGTYFARANFVLESRGGRVLGISEQSTSQYFLPVAQDVDSSYSKEFFELKNFPQKMHKGKMPDLKSSSVYVYSPSSDYAFVDKNSDNIQAIASITKLMTALVFLENNPGWEEIHKITRGDRVNGGRIYLYLGERVRLIDLFNLSLVASANTATEALVNSTGLTESDFVQKMNKKAKSLNMNNTSFVDPIGIGSRNLSSAKDLSSLLAEIIKKKEIRETTEKKEYKFKTLSGVVKKAYSTDGLVGVYPKNGVSLLGGKTGFIDAAGFCFAGIFMDKNNREVISVVLGADSPSARFTETDEAISWVYKNFVW